jgi:hypothetical protein
VSFEKFPVAERLRAAKLGTFIYLFKAASECACAVRYALVCPSDVISHTFSYSYRIVNGRAIATIKESHHLTFRPPKCHGLHEKVFSLRQYRNAMISLYQLHISFVGVAVPHNAFPR